MRPLRRRPKQLTESPSLYQPARSGAGLALSSGDRRRGREAAARPGGTASGTTDEPAELVPLADLGTDTAPALLPRQRARETPRRLSLRPPPRERRPRRGSGELSSLPWTGGSTEL